MSDSRDLIDKTDALLGRYRGAQKSIAETDFPVLTEVFEVAVPAAAPAPASTPAPAPTAPMTAVARPPLQTAEPPQFREDQLVEEVLRRLAPHIDEALGTPLKERLDEHLRAADLVITGEGSLDRSSLMGKGPGEIAIRCRARKLPCLGLGGVVQDETTLRKWFQSAHGLTQLTTPEQAKADAAKWLVKLAEQTARALK